MVPATGVGVGGYEVPAGKPLQKNAVFRPCAIPCAMIRLVLVLTLIYRFFYNYSQKFTFANSYQFPQALILLAFIVETRIIYKHWFT